MLRRPESPAFVEFLLSLLKDPRTILEAFVKRPIGTIYSVGSRIRGEYEVQQVYHGGQGVVVVAHNHRHGRPYALKTLLEQLLISQRARDSFERECRFWIRLGKHPYIIQAFFTPRMSGRLFVAIEPVDPDPQGRITLLDHIRKGRLSAERLAPWALQICCAIEYAQQRGMVCHRDLKPNNILIDGSGTARVTDFGTVKTDETHRAGYTYLAGTLPYIPPEILEGGAKSDARRDVWSLGVSLYHSVAGRLPWNVDSSNPRLWVECIRNRRLEKLNSPFWPTIERCLDPDPGARCSSFRQLRVMLAPVHHEVVGREFIPQSAAAETPEDLLNRGFSEHLLGKPESAIDFYRKGLASEPSSFDCGRLWHNLGRLHASQSDVEAAQECFQRATEIAPDLDRPWIERANLRLAQGDYAGAAELLECAKAVGSRYVDVWLALGELHRELVEWDKASDQFGRAIPIDPTDFDSWWGKGECQFELGHLAEAKTCLRTAIMIDPTRFGISVS